MEKIDREKEENRYTQELRCFWISEVMYCQEVSKEEYDTRDYYA